MVLEGTLRTTRGKKVIMNIIQLQTETYSDWPAGFTGPIVAQML